MQINSKVRLQESSTMQLKVTISYKYEGGIYNKKTTSGVEETKVTRRSALAK